MFVGVTYINRFNITNQSFYYVLRSIQLKLNREHVNISLAIKIIKCFMQVSNPLRELRSQIKYCHFITSEIVKNVFSFSTV